MDIGKRFKRYRENKGLSQCQAAELIGIKNYQLGNYETNRSEPSIDILKKMSQVYDVSIDLLVGNARIKDDSGKIITIEETDYDELMRVIKDFTEEFQKIKK